MIGVCRRRSTREKRLKGRKAEPEDDHDSCGEDVVDDREGEGIRFGDAEEA